MSSAEHQSIICVSDQSQPTACCPGTCQLLYMVHICMQVTVDSQGLIKVAHMGIAGGGGTAMPPRSTNEAAATQGGRNWVQFMMLPEDASIEEDDERPD